MTGSWNMGTENRCKVVFNLRSSSIKGRLGSSYRSAQKYKNPLKLP